MKTVDHVIQTILCSTKLVRNLRRWGAKSSATDRARVADLLRSEKDPIILANAIWCLCAKPLETFDPALLEFVFHANDDVRYYAARLFSNHDEPLIQQAGLTLLEHGDAAIGLKLLYKSGRNENADSIAAALSKHNLNSDLHDFLGDVSKFLESHESLHDTRLALFVYENMPCMFCRSHAVEFLIKWKMCPDWLLEEAVKDGSEDIRKLI